MVIWPGQVNKEMLAPPAMSIVNSEHELIQALTTLSVAIYFADCITYKLVDLRYPELEFLVFEK